jgi:hypothetical protein
MDKIANPGGFAPQFRSDIRASATNVEQSAN